MFCSLPLRYIVLIFFLFFSYLKKIVAAEKRQWVFNGESCLCSPGGGVRPGGIAAYCMCVPVKQSGRERVAATVLYVPC